MGVSDLYGAFALFSVLASVLSIGLLQRNPAWAYVASLALTCILTHAFLSYRFEELGRDPLYVPAYFFAAVITALGLVLLHMLLRIALDLITASRESG